MENNIENNKIIAEFLELEYKILPVYLNDKFLGRKKIYYTPFKRNIKNKVFTPTFSENNLKFHSDWNWLMTVVEKIESLENNLKNETREEFTQFQKVLSLPVYTKIEVVYTACIEFIKWYNKNK